MSMGSRSLGKPSAEQERRFDRLRRNGCHLCRMLGYEPQGGRTEVHHLTVGGKHGAPRLGHEFTIPLCSWHHRGRVLDEIPLVTHMEVTYGPSYALTPKAFRSEYGNDQVLLDEVNRAIGAPPQTIPSKSFRPATEAQTLGGNATHSQDGTLPQRKRRGSKRGTHCVRPDKVLPRGNRIV